MAGGPDNEQNCVTDEHHIRDQPSCCGVVHVHCTMMIRLINCVAVELSEVFLITVDFPTSHIVSLMSIDVECLPFYWQYEFSLTECCIFAELTHFLNVESGWECSIFKSRKKGNNIRHGDTRMYVWCHATVKMSYSSRNSI